MHEPRIETKSAIPLLSIPARFIVGTAEDTTAPQVVGATWGRFNERVGEIAGVESGVTYGYSYYGPPESRWRPDSEDSVHEYWVGIEPRD